MSDLILDQLRDIIQMDIGDRGLRRDLVHNLVNACPDDFRLACKSIAAHPQPGLAIVTGFFIPTATPPAGETDGPLGALFLARALTPLGFAVTLVTDDFCVPALEAGLAACGLRDHAPLVTLPTPTDAQQMSDAEYWRYFDERKGSANLSHLIAIERVGPNFDGRCCTMRGREITDVMSPAHRLFDVLAATRSGALRCASRLNITTIGIGDGGNEIGMGKIPRDVIARNIANGDLVACRVPTDHLIVCGVSNWGAYALAAGILHLREPEAQARDRTASLACASGSRLYDADYECELLELMVQAGPLVDGVRGTPTATVDGLTWEQYAGVLAKMR